MTTLLEPTWAERFTLLMMDGGPRTGLGTEAELDGGEADAAVDADKDDDDKPEGTEKT